MKTLYLILLVVIFIRVTVISGQEIAAVKIHSSNESGDNASANNLNSGESKKITVFNFDVNNIVPEELKKVPEEMTETHFLGDQIAKKMYVFKDLYTYREVIAIGNPTIRTFFNKPRIHHSVKKIEKYIKRSVNKGEMTLDDATAMFNNVLDIAINIYNMNTDQFEDSLRLAGNATDIILVFNKVRLNYNYVNR